MKPELEKTKIVALGAAIFFVIATIFAFTLYFHNIQADKQVLTGQRANTILLAQKHGLQEELDRITYEMMTAKDSNREIKAQFMSLNENLENMTKENLALKTRLTSLRSQNREITDSLQAIWTMMANKFLRKR